MKISVVIPFHNTEKTLVQALDSILNQKGDWDFELLAVDDGSTDTSAEVVKQYQQNHPEANLRLIQQEHQGVSAARNAGLRQSTGNYIAFLDADDEWLPQKTERQMNYLQQPDIDFIAALRNGEKVGFPYRTHDRNLARLTLRKLLIRMEGCTPSVIFKRKILEETGYFDENLTHFEDGNYWMRIAARHSMYLLAEDLVSTGGGKRSFGVSGLSADLKAMQKGMEYNLRFLRKQGLIHPAEYPFWFFYLRFKFVIRLIRNKILPRY